MITIIKQQEGIAMSDSVAKQVMKVGVSITKDKLIELIRKSSQQMVPISQSPNSKMVVIVIAG